MGDVVALDAGTPALPVISVNDDDIRTARRAFVVHRRQPGTARCRLCGWRWAVSRTRTGKPAAGCFRRRQGIETLDTAGLYEGERPSDA